MEKLTPKEMAKKLCDDFYHINDIKFRDESGTSPYISHEYARFCALVTVEALITETRKAYWYEVKQELSDE